MKRKKVLLWILIIVFFVCGAVATLLYLNQWRISQTHGGYSPDYWEPYADSWEIDLADDDTLYLDFSDIDIELSSYDGDKLAAQFEGYRSLRQREDFTPQVEVNEGNQSLSLREANGNGYGYPYFIQLFGFGELIHGSSSLSGTLTVKIPQDWNGNVETSCFSGNVHLTDFHAKDVRVETDSGNTTLEKVTLASLHFEQFSGALSVRDAKIAGSVNLADSSGSIDLAKLSAKDLQIDTFSGAVNLQEITVEQKLQADTSSGNVTFTQCAAKDMLITVFSGEIVAENITTEQFTTDSSSGNVEASFTQMANIQCSSFSSDVELQLPSDAEFALNIDTFSGDIDVSFPITLTNPSDQVEHELSGTVGSGKHAVAIDTSSGNVSIKKSEK